MPPRAVHPPPTSGANMLDMNGPLRPFRVAKGAPTTHIAYDGLHGGKFFVPNEKRAALHEGVAADVRAGQRVFLAEVVPKHDDAIRGVFDIDKLPESVSAADVGAAVAARTRDFFPDAPDARLVTAVCERHTPTRGADGAVTFAPTPVRGGARGVHVYLRVVAPVADVHALAYDLRRSLPAALGVPEVDVDLAIYKQSSLCMVLSHGRAKDPCPSCATKGDGARPPCAPNCLGNGGFCYKEGVYYPSVVVDADGQQNAMMLQHLRGDLRYMLDFFSMFPLHGANATFCPPSDAFVVPEAQRLRARLAREPIAGDRWSAALQTFLRSLHPLWGGGDGLQFGAAERLQNGTIKLQVQATDHYCMACAARHHNRIYFSVAPSGEATQRCYKSQSKGLGKIPDGIAAVLFPSTAAPSGRGGGAGCGGGASDAAFDAAAARLSAFASGSTPPPASAAQQQRPPFKRRRF